MKKSKERDSKGDSGHHHQPRNVFFRKYALIFLVAFIVPLVVTSLYMYVDAYRHATVKKVEQQAPQASTEELMRKMKQMLEDEKARLATLPVIPEANLTHNEPSIDEKNATTTAQKPEESVKPVVHHEDDNKTHELSEVHEYKNYLKEEKPANYKPSEVIRKKYPPGTTPKLAIIIDDVSFPWQTRMMKEIPYKVTPAFFPPTKGHPETVRLSHEFPFAMIHLPLEAKYFSRPEEDTLNTTDSYETIEKRIKRIKALFPHITYYNNHTGGYFTAHYEAMDKLIGIMKANELVFVDSRTIGNSKAPEVTKKHNMFLYSRDVFLDNSLNKSEIRTQLQLAVSKAKKNGYAIAIGHPHKNTLEVLRDSKELVRDVEMVYLNEL